MRMPRDKHWSRLTLVLSMANRHQKRETKNNIDAKKQYSDKLLIIYFFDEYV